VLSRVAAYPSHALRIFPLRILSETW
jgi:hypothetical protein